LYGFLFSVTVSSLANNHFIFKIGIKPFKKLSLPDYSILRFCDPMTFILKEEKPAWHTMKLRSGKCLQTLSIWNPEIILSGYNKYRCRPFIDHEMRGKFIAWLIFPIGTSVILIRNQSSSVDPYSLSKLNTPQWATNALNLPW